MKITDIKNFITLKPARRQRHRPREKDGHRPEQRPPPLALRYRGPEAPRRQDLLPKVLHRINGPYQ
jgi:hypothetical protein